MIDTIDYTHAPCGHDIVHQWFMQIIEGCRIYRHVYMHVRTNVCPSYPDVGYE